MASRKPRWVIVRENEEARRAAARDARKSPHAAIADRLARDPEFQAKKAAAMARIEAAINEFYAALPTDAAEAVGFLRLHGGRTAIRRRIIAEQASESIFLSQMFGSAPLSQWISTDDVLTMEIRAIRERSR